MAQVNPNGVGASPSKLAHFVLKTSRFQEMIDWYGTVLCARIVHGNPLGGTFDPDAMISRLDAGEPVYELAHASRDPNGPSPVQIRTEMGLYRY